MYTTLDGKTSSARFDDLETLADGQVALESGWFIDRVNRIRSSSRYLEFRSGPENPPGVVSSVAVEVTPEQAQETIRMFAANNSLKSDVAKPRALG
jgi:hypothetical protein